MTWEDIERIKQKPRDQMTVKEKQLANLKNINESLKNETHEEKIARTRKAGQASGAKKKKRVELRNVANDLLSADFSEIAKQDEKLSRLLQLLGNDAPTGADCAMLAQILKAMKGDTEAFKFLRDTSGQRPVDIQSVSISRGDLDGVDLRTVSTEDLIQIASESEEDGTST